MKWEDMVDGERKPETLGTMVTEAVHEEVSVIAEKNEISLSKLMRIMTYEWVTGRDSPVKVRR